MNIDNWRFARMQAKRVTKAIDPTETLPLGNFWLHLNVFLMYRSLAAEGGALQRNQVSQRVVHWTSVSGKYEEDVNNLRLIKSFELHSFFHMPFSSSDGPVCLSWWVGIRDHWGPHVKTLDCLVYCIAARINSHSHSQFSSLVMFCLLILITPMKTLKLNMCLPKGMF